jgi:hypothetical protein
MLSYLIPSNSRFDLALANFVIRLFYPGVVGILGLYCASRIGFKVILNDEIKQKNNILMILLAGIIMGAYFIGYETLFDKILNIHILQYYISKFPSVIFNSLAEGIGDQIVQMFRLSLLIWLFSKILKIEKGCNKLFWVVSAICALWYTIDHIPYTFLYHTNDFRFSGIGLYDYIRYMGLFIGLYGSLALVCAYFFKRFGLLSAIAINFITEISWRFLWAWIYKGPRIFFY